MTITLLALTLFAAPAADQSMSSPTATRSATAPATSAAEYVRLAGASDLYEINSSRLALERSRDPAIRQFAQTMIDHHTRTTQQVTAAATAAGLTLEPPVLDAEQTRMVTELTEARSKWFDKLYHRQQKLAHQQALALHQGYSTQGDQPELRQVATAAVPIVQQHIDMLKNGHEHHEQSR